MRRSSPLRFDIADWRARRESEATSALDAAIHSQRKRAGHIARRFQKLPALRCPSGEGSMILGIDLGTINSAAAIWSDGVTQLIPNNLVIGSHHRLSASMMRAGLCRHRVARPTNHRSRPENSELQTLYGNPTSRDAGQAKLFTGGIVCLRPTITLGVVCIHRNQMMAQAR